MEFVIDRSKWRSGGEGKNKIGKGITQLLNDNGFMCCLGQTCKQLGVSDKDLKGLGEPSEIEGKKKYLEMPEIFVSKKENIDYFTDELTYYFLDTELSGDAIEINDDEEIGQREREQKLRELFKKNGHKIKFIGKSFKNKK